MSKARTFAFLDANRHVGGVTWLELIPNKRHTWLTADLHTDFDTFIPIGSKSAKAIQGDAEGTLFKTYSLGVATNRDAWVYNFNRTSLTENVQRMIKCYNAQTLEWVGTKNKSGVNLHDFVDSDPQKISWSEGLKRKLRGGHLAEFAESKLRESLYRPFTKANLFFDRVLNERVSIFPSIFPIPDAEKENRVICVAGIGDRKGFGCLATSSIPSLDLAFEKNQCFPFYTYGEDGTNRRENITDWTLTQFRTRYRDDTITKWDIFHYTYGILHHPDYRERYQENLKRDLPHIPFAEGFWGFSKAGARLADLHVNYESQPEYDKLNPIETPGMQVDLSVDRMKFSKDKTRLKYNEFLTLESIPTEVFDYRLGNRSALEWVVDQYRVKVDKRSGIKNDPNRAEDPEYILRLIGQVITVSLETVDIVERLPAL